MTAADVPAQVLAELLRADSIAPIGPCPSGGRVEWWARHAESDEVAQRAYERLHMWAVTAGCAPAVGAAIREAITSRMLDARRCRAEAERVREGRR